MLPGPVDNLISGHGSRLSGNLFAMMKENHGGNGLDGELAGQDLFRFGIDLGQADMGFKEAGGLVKGRGHHFTGPAPGRPEIDEDRDVIAADVAREKGACQINRGAGEKGLGAFAAFGAIG